MISTSYVQASTTPVKFATAASGLERDPPDSWYHTGTFSFVFDSKTSGGSADVNTLLAALQKAVDSFKLGRATEDISSPEPSGASAFHNSAFEAIVANRGQYPDEAFKIRTDYVDGGWTETEIPANPNPSYANEEAGYNPAAKLNGMLTDYFMDSTSADQ